MENTSPFLAMQQVERLLKALLRTVDTDLLSTDERRVVSSMRQLTIDARLDIRDYELSETRDEQLKMMHTAKRRVAKLEASIVAASSVFGPADVAQLSAQLEQIQGRLL